MGFDWERAGMGAATFGNSEGLRLLNAGGGGGGGFNEGLYQDRRNQINSYESNLANARNRYLASVGDMYNQSYNRFAQNAEPMFAARGLEVNGGAFASELARKSADYSAQLTPMAFQAEREDLSNVENLRQGLFGGQAAASNAWDLTKYNNSQQNMRAIGGLAGQLGLMALTGGSSAAAPAVAGKMNPFSPGQSSAGPWSGGGGAMSPNGYGSVYNPLGLGDTTAMQGPWR